VVRELASPVRVMEVTAGVVDRPGMSLIPVVLLVWCVAAVLVTCWIGAIGRARHLTPAHAPGNAPRVVTGLPAPRTSPDALPALVLGHPDVHV
jgi:hypothetical protein